MSKLFAKVFQHPNYGGQYRWITADIRSFSNDLGFNDKVSSIIVYKGNNYAAGDKFRFYKDANFNGGYLDLGPGYYPDIHVQPYSFGDKISSVDYLPPSPASDGINVRLVIRLYDKANYGGQYRDVLLSESKLANMDFNNKASSIKVFAGEDYAPGWVCNFYDKENYSGGQLQPGNFGPGTSLADISKAPYSFSNTIGAVKISEV